MTDKETQLQSLLMAVLVAAATIPAVGAGPVAAATSDPTTFHLTQDGQCTEFTPIGDGSTSVEDYYDYRNNETDPEGEFSSYGTTGIQENQVSNLFVYNGANGFSLVFLHDKYGENGNYASTITFTLDNMSNGEWVVRDDTYGNDTQDDDWETSTSTHKIDWKWGSKRTDGGAFHGFGDSTITIDPGFNEDADHWGDWPASEDEHRIDEWQLLGDGGNEVLTLNKDQQVSVAKGGCPDTTDPTADLTASPTTVGNNEEVSFDASGSSDNEEITEYKWDFDGDGQVDDQTTAATVDHAYTSTGEYNASVTVVDGNGNNATANVTITVEEQSTTTTETETTTTETTTTETTTSTTTTKTSTTTTEDPTTTTTTTEDPTTTTTEDPTTTTTTETSTTTTEDPTTTTTTTEDPTTTTTTTPSDSPPKARLSAADSGSMSHPFALDPGASTDDNAIKKYKWDVDNDGEVDWIKDNDDATAFKPYKHFDEPGTHKASVTVVDSAGQTDTATVEFTIKNVAPTAVIDETATTVEVGETVTFTGTDFNEDPSLLDSIGWKVDGEVRANGLEWTTSFDEKGDKTVELVLEDLAGNHNVIEQPITVEAADDGSDPGSSDPGDSNPDKGLDDGDDDEDSKSGSIPSVGPGNSNDGNQNDGDDSKSNDEVSAPLNGDDGQIGEIVLRSDASNDAPTLEVNQTAPAGVEVPTAAADGFEALSYVTVTGADRATVSVSKAQLNASGATADAVTLFRYDDGTWTALETTQVEETDDAYRFRANATNGTYAVGVDRPATSVTDLAVNSQQVQPGETVTITATVENAGRAAGQQEVTLTVGGEAVASRTVSVGADATKEITFDHAFDASGTYDVSAGDANAEIVVESVETETPTTTEAGSDETTSTTTNDGGPGIPGFGVGVSLVALLAAALLALRRN